MLNCMVTCRGQDKKPDDNKTNMLQNEVSMLDHYAKSVNCVYAGLNSALAVQTHARKVVNPVSDSARTLMRVVSVNNDPCSKGKILPLSQVTVSAKPG